jgi:hypothetical protein
MTKATRSILQNPVFTALHEFRCSSVDKAALNSLFGGEIPLISK